MAGIIQKSSTPCSPPSRRVTFSLGVLLFAMSLVACSSTSDVYDTAHSASSLRAAGWSAKSASGMPNTISQVRQVGYLETTAPDGTRIDIQFLEDPTKAGQELAAVKGQDATFVGTAIGNSLVFGSDATKAVPQSDLAVMKALLRR